MRIRFGTCSALQSAPRPPRKINVKIGGMRRIWLRIPFTRKGVLIEMGAR